MRDFCGSHRAVFIRPWKRVSMLGKPSIPMTVGQAPISGVGVKPSALFLKRHAWTVGTCTVAGIALGVLAVLVIPPTYRAQMVIDLNGLSQASASPDVVRGLSLDAPDAVMTQVQLLTSPKVTYEAYQAAGIKDIVLGSDNPVPDIQVEPMANTNIAMVTVDWTDKDQTRKVAEQLPVAFRNYVIAQRSEEINNVRSQLESQRDAFGKQIAAAEALHSKFTVEHGLVNMSANTTDAIARTTQAKMQLEAARASYNAATQRLTSLTAQRLKIHDDRSVPVITANGDRLEDAKKQLSDLTVQRAQLLSDYLPDSLQVKRVDSMIAAQTAYIKQLSKTVDRSATTRNPLADTLDSAIAEARAGVDSSSAALGTAQAFYDEMEREQQALVKLVPQNDELERKLGALRQSYFEVGQKIDELTRARASRDPAEIVQDPYVYDSPVRPRPVLYISLATILGLIFGVVVGRLRDSVQDRVISIGESVDTLGVPLLGGIPALPAGERALTGAASALVDDRFRSLALNVLNFAKSNKFSVVVASSYGNESRSRISQGLAYTYAERFKVVYIDGNVSAPVNPWKVSADSGLLDVLCGLGDAPAKLVDGPLPNLKVLPVGQMKSKGPLPMIDVDMVEKMFTDLKAVADIVILDAPPVAASSDAGVFAAKSDGCIYVAKLGTTPKAMLRYALSQLRYSGANVWGTVFSNVSGTADSVELAQIE